MRVVDLHPLHHEADQLPALVPVHVRHPLVHATGKVLQSANEERQGVPLRRVVPQGPGLRFPGLDPLAKAGHPRLELRALDQALGIAVYEAPHAAAQLGKLHLDSCEIEPTRATASRCLEPALVLQGDSRGVTQHVLDFPPHGRVQHVHAQLRIGTRALAIGAAGIAAGAAIVGVAPELASRRACTAACAAVCVATRPADQQAL